MFIGQLDEKLFRHRMYETPSIEGNAAEIQQLSQYPTSSALFLSYGLAIFAQFSPEYGSVACSDPFNLWLWETRPETLVTLMKGIEN